MILEHYRGEEAPTDRGERGLRAYDVWMYAFRGGRIEPNGNAYNFAVVQDSRRLAAEFFSELEAEWQGDDDSAACVRKICTEAAQLYRQMAEQLRELIVRFPFPSGGDPNSAVNSERAVQVLQDVKAREEQAVSLLEQLLEAI